MRRNLNWRVCQFKLRVSRSTRNGKLPSFRSNPFAETRRKQSTETLRKRDGNILNVSANGNAAETPNIVIIRLNYRIQGHFSSYSNWDGSAARHSTRLASRRAVEPLNNIPYIPYSFYKHSTRLASRRAAESLNNWPYIPYSFYKHSTRLVSRRAGSNNRPQKMALYSVVAPLFQPWECSRFSSRAWLLKSRATWNHE